MSSFGVKNILRKNSFTRDLFFNSSEAITDYLSKRNLQFCYTNILAESFTATRREERKLSVTPNCKKQYLLVFESEKLSLSKEYLFSCKSCLQFDFWNFSSTEEEISDYLGDLDCLIMKTQKDTESNRFFSLQRLLPLWRCTGLQVEPLCFVQITEKGVAESRLSDIYFQEKNISKDTHYLKIGRSRSISLNQLAVLLSDNIYFSSDEIYEYTQTSIQIFWLDINIYNSLLYKARLWNL